MDRQGVILYILYHVRDEHNMNILIDFGCLELSLRYCGDPGTCSPI